MNAIEVKWKSQIQGNIQQLTDHILIHFEGGSKKYKRWYKLDSIKIGVLEAENYAVERL